MKKRTAFIGVIFSLIPLGQPFLVKGGFSLITSAFVIIHHEKVNAESAQFFYNRAFDKLNAEDYKGAISDFTEVLKINPKNENAYYNRGIAKANLEDYKGAISDYTKVIKINPKDGESYHGRGLAKGYLEDYKGAISDFTESIKINPKDGESYLDRSFSKQLIGDIKGAVSDNNTGLEIYAKNEKNNFELSTKDILTIDYSSDPLLIGFNKYAGFDGNSYTRPITYYIHDKKGKLNSKSLPKYFKKTYKHTLDEEKFIVNFISKIDKYIDLDFQRVNSKTNAMISIYKTNIYENIKGMAMVSYKRDDVRSRVVRVDIAWSDSKLDIPKLKKYPTLSVDSAYTIIHEIGHALGLKHMDNDRCGEYCQSNLDPEDRRINNEKTIMSYNNFLYPVDDIFFTQLDLKALRKKWGVEKGN